MPDGNRHTLQVVICRSNPVAPDPRVEKIARSLDGRGFRVTVIAWDRSGEMAPRQETGAATIVRLAIKARYGHGLANLPALMRWQWGLLIWLVRNAGSFQALHACDFDTILPALLVSRIYRKKLIYDIFDFYADHLRATPAWIKRLIRWVDLRAINLADGVILADDSRQDQIRGARPARLAIVYNSPEELLQDATAPQMDRGVPHDNLRLAYIGLLQVERGLLPVLEVLQGHPTWSLDLAGFGGDSERILSIANGIPNVRWHGRVPYEQALRLSQAADVLLATYDPAIPNHRYASPNKVFEGMMLGKPVIVAEGTHMDRLVTSASCGLVVPYGDKDALERALLQLEGQAEMRRQLGDNGRKAYLASYSWAEMQRRLLALYAQVLGDVP